MTILSIAIFLQSMLEAMPHDQLGAEMSHYCLNLSQGSYCVNILQDFSEQSQSMMYGEEVSRCSVSRIKDLRAVQDHLTSDDEQKLIQMLSKLTWNGAVKLIKNDDGLLRFILGNAKANQSFQDMVKTKILSHSHIKDFKEIHDEGVIFHYILSNLALKETYDRRLRILLRGLDRIEDFKGHGRLNDSMERYILKNAELKKAAYEALSSVMENINLFELLQHTRNEKLDYMVGNWRRRGIMVDYYKGPELWYMKNENFFELLGFTNEQINALVFKKAAFLMIEVIFDFTFCGLFFTQRAKKERLIE